ncbi:unnamed protein product [Bursaphelenchus okinawaensis]|uniref:Uncharacterized protein n=1 Tax=Bursaphelenchus okinawaensis TaxID=465554 RepID=A0A811KUI8_9BILA|nr:unnamed protein product [Bursaphelenchus okinawaensis]CAG9112118.1 unnamed protein product [Bursaphelenchus okinawaensis]
MAQGNGEATEELTANGVINDSEATNDKVVTNDNGETENNGEANGNGTTIDSAATNDKNQEIRKEKRRRKRNTKAGRALMGVGKMLEQYRQLATEGGNLDIDDNENGNIVIGGSELTFESWGQMTRTNDDDIVRADFVPPSQKRKKLNVSPIQWVHLGKSKAGTSVNGKKKDSTDDKDEGELSDSDQSDDSMSSDSDDDAPRRHKRKKRRQQQYQAPATQGSMSLQELFTKAYKIRDVVVQSFSLNEKMTFLNAVRQT